MANAEATEAKIDALSKRVDETKEDVRELRADVKALRGEMHAGFATLRESIASVAKSVADVEKSVAALQGMMQVLFWGAGIVVALAIVFFGAGKALHWFEGRGTTQSTADLTHPATPSPPAALPREAPAATLR